MPVVAPAPGITARSAHADTEDEERDRMTGG